MKSIEELKKRLEEAIELANKEFKKPKFPFVIQRGPDGNPQPLTKEQRSSKEMKEYMKQNRNYKYMKLGIFKKNAIIAKLRYDNAVLKEEIKNLKKEKRNDPTKLLEKKLKLEERKKKLEEQMKKIEEKLN